MTYVEHVAWLDHGGGQAMWDELSAQFGLKSFAVGNIDTPPFGWFKKEIKSVDDFKGVKMRMPGIGAEMIRSLVRCRRVMPPGDVFAALQSGALDATDFTGPANDMALGFPQVCKYHLLAVHAEAGRGPADAWLVRPNTTRCPDLLKRVITVACAGQPSGHAGGI